MYEPCDAELASSDSVCASYEPAWPIGGHAAIDGDCAHATAIPINPDIVFPINSFNTSAVAGLLLSRSAAVLLGPSHSFQQQKTAFTYARPDLHSDVFSLQHMNQVRKPSTYMHAYVWECLRISCNKMRTWTH